MCRQPLSLLACCSAWLLLAACDDPATTSSDAAAVGRAAIPAAGAGSARIAPWGIDLAARDLSVAPGDDFNAYANGAWMQAYEIPADQARFGVFTELSIAAEADVREIVESLAGADAAAGSLEQKVGDYFGAWMSEALLESLGAEPLMQDLQEIGAIGNQAQLMAAFASLHYAAPFSIGIIPDPEDTTRYIVTIDQSGLGLPDRDYYLSEDDRFVQYRAAYARYITAVMTLAGFDAAAARASRLIALETALARVHWSREDSRNIELVYNPMSLAELSALAPDFDWAAIFSARGLGTPQSVVVGETTAIAAAGELFRTADLADVRDYLAFHFIRRSAQYLSPAFDAAHFELYSRTLQGREAQRERWRRGVQEVNGALGEAVGQIYVERHFPPANRAQMEELVNNLTAAMSERLSVNDWMDEATRAEAQVKLGNFEPRIGYPVKWTDYSRLEINADSLLANVMAVREFEWQLEVERLAGPVDRDLWGMSPQTVNAYYSPLLNQITFPAAILQPPFFDPGADPAVNYGAIGAVIGHEIGHGFDDQGRRFDAEGRIRDWWTEAANERFAQRAQRLGLQYDSYEVLPGTFINGSLTMGENIGDLGGLQMAYAAYRRYLDATSDGEAPVLDGLTGDQRFFLAWAQVWRAKAREDYLRSQVVSDPHSPTSFRINGVVRNLDAWYDAFGVTADHALYLPPEDRVSIW